MKQFKTLLPVLFIVGILCMAQGMYANTDCTGYRDTYPDHYCDCKEQSATNRIGWLPIDMEINDSIWFKSTSEIFMDGFTAYVFSDCDVQFDVYQRCTSKNTLYSIVIPKNQAHDVTAETIKQKLEEAGFSDAGMAVYVCIHPLGGTGGRFIAYPYNTGPHSTCSDLLPLLPNMTYVSSNTNDIYELKASDIPDSCGLYIEWIEENNLSCSLEVIAGSCYSQAIETYDFMNSGEYYHFNPALLKEVRDNGESLYLRFNHEAPSARIRLHEATILEHERELEICQGMSLEVGDTVITTDGRYPYGYEWMGTELMYHFYQVSFVAPEAQADTISLLSTELPYLYRDKYTIPANGFGDYDVTIHADGECDERYLLHVAHRTVTDFLSIDTTLCQGKVYKYGSMSIAQDTAFVDSAWIHVDTLLVSDVQVQFTAPEIQYDTLCVLASELPMLYLGQGLIPEDGFGDYDFIIKRAGSCDERYLVHVEQDTIVFASVDTTLCQGKVFEYNGKQYTKNTTFVDSTWIDDETQLATTVRVRFTAPDIQYDTLYLKSTDLPYLYRDQFTIPANGFGDYDITLHYDNDCDERYMLHVIHATTTEYASIDTTLCQGKVFRFRGIAYASDTAFVDSTWVDADTYVITDVTALFTAPEMEYDSVLVSTEDLLAGYYYAVADAYIYAAGTYVYDITAPDTCDRVISLTVTEDIKSAVEQTAIKNEKPQLFIHQGKVFIRRGEEVFTLLGERL